jgi:cyclin-dependent kinase
MLIDENSSTEVICKIADLGLGRQFSVPIKSYTHEIVTLWYRAPEVLLGATHYGCAVDMWSVGCIMAELVRKTPLFPGDCEWQQLLHIFKLLGTPTEEMWPGVTRLRDWHDCPKWKPQPLDKYFTSLDKHGLDLLSRLLEYDPARRLSAKEALDHPWFDDLDKATIDGLENPELQY